MRRWLAALLVVALLSGCARIQAGEAPEQNNDVTMQLRLSDAPVVGTPSVLEVTLMRAGEPMTGAVVQVEGAMAHAGMEPLLVEAVEQSAGKYQATLPWTMGGEWIVTARATLPDGSIVWQSLESVQVASP